MSFGYYKSLTLAAAQAGSADSTDWPLAICLDGNVQAADADLKTVGNGGYVQSSSGYDIRPYADSALTTPLTFELVYYQASTGKLEMHVKIPTLSHSVDTVIYLAFGDASITTDGSSASTWNSNYKAVYHLKDGSTLSLTDSVGSFNGTNHSATATSGEIDGGVAFSGSAQWVDTNVTGPNFNIANGTIEWWQYNTNAYNSGLWETVWGNTNLAGSSELVFLHYSDNSLYLGWNSGGLDSRVHLVGTAARWPQNTWTNYVFSWDASSANLFINGAFAGGNAAGSVINTGSNMQLGRQGDYSGINYWAGKLDEWRFLNSVVTTAWVNANYNSQKSSSTFISWGARTVFTGADTLFAQACL